MNAAMMNRQRDARRSGFGQAGSSRKRSVYLETKARDQKWKRRGTSYADGRLAGLIALGFCGMLGLGLLAMAILPNSVDKSLGGPFGQAVLKAFPEADTARIALGYTEIDGDEYPSEATLHLPTSLLGNTNPGDPFNRLATNFGVDRKELSAIELSSRLKQIATASLPANVTHCYTYEIEDQPDDHPRKTRVLHLSLNPGC